MLYNNIVGRSYRFVRLVIIRIKLILLLAPLTAVELLLGFMTVVYGLGMINPYTEISVTSAVWAGIYFYPMNLLPEWGYGLIYLLVGLLQLHRVLSNGRGPQRFITQMVTFVWTFAFIASLIGAIETLGPYLYGSVALASWWRLWRRE